MIWAGIALVLFLLLHKAVEPMVVERGEHPSRRRLYWNLGTAGFFVVALLGLWVFSFFNASWRMEYGGVLFLGSPVLLIVIAIFAYMNYIVYGDGDEEAGSWDR